MGKNYHSYHLVNPSPWPISVSAALLGVTIGAVMFFHAFTRGIYLLLFSLVLLQYYFFLVERFIREGTYLKNHTKEVLAGLRLVLFYLLFQKYVFLFILLGYFHSS